MCNCEKHPTINGEPGYRWNNEQPHVRPVSPPELMEGDTLLYDEPGRCGGLDAHSHHYRLVVNGGRYALLVRHGGGDERLELSCTANVAIKTGSFANMDTHGRFWLMSMLKHVADDAARSAQQQENRKWINAAAEKRIKTRKCKDRVKVWIEPKITVPEVNV